VAKGPRISAIAVWALVGSSLDFRKPIRRNRTERPHCNKAVALSLLSVPLFPIDDSSSNQLDLDSAIFCVAADFPRSLETLISVFAQLDEFPSKLKIILLTI
jgi:hypothetical protein